MRAEDWPGRWRRGDETDAVLITFADAHVERARLADNDFQILTRHGLPDDAVPFLSFCSSQGLLSAVRADGLAPEGLERFIEIGFNGSGDPICLDAEDGAVYYLNHDNDYVPVFMNSSVTSLARFLLCFRGDDLAGVEIDDFEYSAAAVEQMRQAMNSIDAAALAEGAMWVDELAMIEVTEVGPFRRIARSIRRIVRR